MCCILLMCCILRDGNRSKAEKATLISQRGLYLCRQLPTLPHTFASSTIGPAGLNLRVRDRKGKDISQHLSRPSDSQFRCSGKFHRTPPDRDVAHCWRPGWEAPPDGELHPMHKLPRC